MEKIERNASDINATLQTMQKDWYDGIDAKYKDNKNFSSPFCFGVSEKTIEECNGGKKLLMYVGEEAKDWCFSDNSTIKYIQDWAIAYFEKQFGEYNEKRLKAIKDEDKGFLAKKNRSQFWNLLKRIKKESKCEVCWNDLDKLHQGKTKAKLEDDQEIELHKFKDNHSLLWHEINLVKPEYIIFMGPSYSSSIEAALSLEKGILKKKPNLSDKIVVEIDCKHFTGFDKDYKPERVFWICHPTQLCRSKNGSKYTDAWKPIVDIINHWETKKQY